MATPVRLLNQNQQEVFSETHNPLNPPDPACSQAWAKRRLARLARLAVAFSEEPLQPQLRKHSHLACSAEELRQQVLAVDWELPLSKNLPWAWVASEVAWAQLQVVHCKLMNNDQSEFYIIGLTLSSGNTQNTQQQPQQPQKPSLGLFANASTTQQPLQQSTATGNVVPGVKVDLTNLLPTTKYESCADELRREIENIDNAIHEQIRMCNEVADILPTIEQQGSTIPNDVEFVQGKLDTIQHALENDASDIDHLRGLVTRDAAEAQVAFRAIDTLKLPMQYQSSGGGGWWSVHDQKVPDRGSLRSTRKNTLALPDDVEVDPSTANTVNGVPVNLVDYFSQRSDEMGAVLGRYKGNLKEIEDHLHGVEVNLNRQIHDFVSSRSRDGSGAGTPKSAVNDLAAVLGDVEAGIMGVAARLGGVTEQVQEVSLGPLGLGDRM